MLLVRYFLILMYLLFGLFHNVQTTEGYEILRVEENNIVKYGILDSTGRVLLDPVYSNIEQVTDCYFAVSAPELSLTPEVMMLKNIYKKALFNGKQFVTDEGYYILEHVNDDLFYVFDGKNYYFLDAESKDKKIVEDLEGPLTFEMADDKIMARYDDGYHHIVYVIDGENIESIKTSIDEWEDVRVVPKLNVLDIHPVLIPVVTTNQMDVTLKINEDLERQFSLTTNDSIESDFYLETMNISYEISRWQDYLQVTKYVYYYGVGAAHGDNQLTTYVYDLQTGQNIDINDLFKSDVDYDKILALSMADQAAKGMWLYEDITTMDEQTIVDYFRRDRYNFLLEEDMLIIYYNQYQIAPYAAGVIWFELPLNTLEELKVEILNKK